MSPGCNPTGVRRRPLRWNPEGRHDDPQLLGAPRLGQDLSAQFPSSWVKGATGTAGNRISTSNVTVGKPNVQVNTGGLIDTNIRINCHGKTRGRGKRAPTVGK
jgi:hypothetical protein